jgi:membrane peptidoglycan carboxypeptidase
MQTRSVLDPTNAANNAALASQVQYAMSMTTVNGTGTAAAVGLGNRPIIAKTGTTTNSHAGFFIGAIPQYSLVVGMFTESQAADSPENLGVLTGGGFGGYWPAKIWNTFAQAEFASLPVQNFENPVFSGNKWVQIGKIPKKTACTFKIRGKKITVPLTGKNKNKKCNQVTPTPTPTPTQTQRCNGHKRFCGPTPSTSPTASPTFGFPTPSTSPTATPTGTTTATPPGTATATPTNTATGPGNGGGPVGNTTTASGVQAGVAVGGVLTVLPGSLLWTTLSRRRRRRRKGTAE